MRRSTICFRPRWNGITPRTATTCSQAGNTTTRPGTPRCASCRCTSTTDRGGQARWPERTPAGRPTIARRGHRQLAWLHRGLRLGTVEVVLRDGHETLGLLVGGRDAGLTLITA